MIDDVLDEVARYLKAHGPSRIFDIYYAVWQMDSLRRRCYTQPRVGLAYAMRHDRRRRFVVNRKTKEWRYIARRRRRHAHSVGDRSGEVTGEGMGTGRE
jgi:hypothetical protein